MLIGSHGMLTFFFFTPNSSITDEGHRLFFLYAVLLQGCSSCTQLRSVSSFPLYSWEPVRDEVNGSTMTCLQTYSTQPVKYVPSLSAGHVVGPVLSHSFCNSQGLPDISSALQHPQRSALLFSYVMGLLLFLVLLFPLTDPFFYGAIPVCSLAPPPESVCQIKWN